MPPEVLTEQINLETFLRIIGMIFVWVCISALFEST